MTKPKELIDPEVTLSDYCQVIQTAIKAVIESRDTLTPTGVSLSIPTLQQIEDTLVAKYLVDKIAEEKETEY